MHGSTPSHVQTSRFTRPRRHRVARVNAHPTRRSDVDLVAADDGFLASRPDSSTVTWLNRTAAMVLSLCTGQNDERAIARALASAFDLTAPPAESVASAIGELITAGLITPGDHTVAGEPWVVVVLWAPGVSMETGVLEGVTRILDSMNEQGIRTQLVVDRGANVRKSRNRAASAMVVRGDATHILFLDATRDALRAVQEMSVARAVGSGHDVVGFPIAYGEVDWSRVHGLRADDAAPDEATLAAFARSYDVAFGRSAGGRRIRDGYMEAYAVNSGALLVTRSVLERMAGSGSVTPARGIMVRTGIVAVEPAWGFFDPRLGTDDIDLDEDVAFCERCRESGAPVMLDTTGSFGRSIRAARRQLASDA